jgi:hypothetical protein
VCRSVQRHQVSLATPSGNKFFLLHVDDFSRYMWASLLGSKDSVATAIKHIQVAAAEEEWQPSRCTENKSRG